MKKVLFASMPEELASNVQNPQSTPPPTGESASNVQSAPQPAPKLASNVQIVRNAPCSCGSRLKYKRCCGKSAPPVPGDDLAKAA
jgi:uncharacterized protein YecA (UPF0149 family)